MLAYAAVVIVVILPLTFLCLRPSPESLAAHPVAPIPAGAHGARHERPIWRWG